MHSQVYKEEEEKENKDPLSEKDNNETKCHNSKRKKMLWYFTIENEKNDLNAKFIKTDDPKPRKSFD